MLSSALAFILTALLVTTFLAGITFLIRIAATFLIARLINKIKGKPSPVFMVKNALMIAHPVGFLTSILHGFWAIALAIKVFSWFELDKDPFIGVLVASIFIIRDLPKVLSKTQKKENIQKKEGEITILEEPYDEGLTENNFQQNPFGNMNMGNSNPMQDYFKDQYQEFMQGNSLVGFIGRLTGAILGTLSYIGL